MSQKVHMFPVEDVIRSVLRGHKVTANCGVVKTITREDVDAAVGAKTCADCIAATNQDYEEWTVRSPRGWTALLESAWIADSDAKKAQFTSSFFVTGSWTDSGSKRNDFPLGA